MAEPKRLSFGQALTEAREFRGLSKYALGKRVGLHDTNIWRWESSVVRPTSASIRRLAKALGVVFVAYGERWHWAVEDRRGSSPGPSGKSTLAVGSIRSDQEEDHEQARSERDGASTRIIPSRAIRPESRAGHL